MLRNDVCALYVDAKGVTTAVVIMYDGKDPFVLAFIHVKASPIPLPFRFLPLLFRSHRSGRLPER